MDNRFNMEHSLLHRLLYILERTSMEENNAISPKHYKEIVPGYEYMDMMVFMLKDFDGVEAHLMGQVYKYLMRYGKKDDKLQELEKVQWYLNYLIKEMKERE